MAAIIKRTLARVVLVFTILITFPAFAATIAKIGSTELVNDSELIFEGLVTSVASEKAPNGYIYTYVTFQVNDVLIGSLVSNSLVLRFTGGTVDGSTLDVGAVYPEMNERGIYFVERVAPGLINPLLGWTQGHFTIVGNDVVLAGNEEPVQSVSQRSVSELQISQDVAEGIETSAVETGLNSGMSITDFKQAITTLKQ